MFPFSWQKQRDLVDILSVVSSMSCSWAQGPEQGHSTGAQPQLSGGWHSRQRNKATKPCSPVAFQSSLPSPLVLGCEAHYLKTGELVLQNHFFPWAKGALWDQSLAQDAEDTLWRSKVTLNRRAKQQRSWLVLPRLPHSHTSHHGHTDMCLAAYSVWLWGTALEFHRVKILVIQNHLPENNRKTFRINLLERCHSYTLHLSWHY